MLKKVVELVEGITPTLVEVFCYWQPLLFALQMYRGLLNATQFGFFKVEKTLIH